VSTIVPAGPGNSSALESIETTFHQDLNGDGVIGVPTPTVPAQVVENFQSRNQDITTSSLFTAAADSDALTSHLIGSSTSGARIEHLVADVLPNIVHHNISVTTDGAGTTVDSGFGSSGAFDSARGASEKFDFNAPVNQASLISPVISAPDDATIHNFAMSSLFMANGANSGALTGHSVWGSTSDAPSEHFATDLLPNPVHQNFPVAADAGAESNGAFGGVVWSASEKFDFKTPVDQVLLVSPAINAPDDAATHNFAISTDHLIGGSISDAQSEHFAAGLLPDPVHQTVPAADANQWNQVHELHWLV
jgi:hypothetical protein